MARAMRVFAVGALLALTSPVWGQYPSDLVGFNGPPFDDINAHEMFRIPEFSGTTNGYILLNVTGLENNNAYRAAGLHTEGDAGLYAFYDWLNPADPSAWMRLTTFNGDERPNPVLDSRGKVRFKLTNQAELFTGEIGICLGIRETGGLGIPQLGDGGTTGVIEWFGVDTTVNAITAGADGIVNTTATGDDVQEYPVGYDVILNGHHPDIAVISPGTNGTIDTAAVPDDEERYGFFIGGPDDNARIPIPAITLPPNPDPYELEWDFTAGTVSVGGTPVACGTVGFTGNGTLADCPDFRGTLEHIAITNVASDPADEMKFGIDELQFEATIPDPTPPPVIRAPVVDTDTEVEVECIDEATEAELFIGIDSAGVVTPVDGVATFSPLSLEEGDVLTATQTANGAVSPLSNPVVVYAAGTALADNFDGYASQDDLEIFWTQTDPETDRKILLATGSAASCENMVVSDYASGPPVSRLYVSLGQVNGAVGDPLVVTYYFKHDSNNTNARARFELTPSLSRAEGAVGFAFTNGLAGDYTAQYTTFNVKTLDPTDTDTFSGHETDYFGYDYSLTNIDRVPGVWHKMEIVITDVVNFWIDDVFANGSYYPSGIPRANQLPFQYLIIGLGYSNNGPAMMYDNVSVTMDGTSPPFDDPNPVDSPTIVGPLFPADTLVDLIDVDPTATDVTVYADGSNVGSATGPFPTGDATVTVTALDLDAVVTATQTVLVVESCYSAPVVVAVPAPTLDATLVPGQTLVDVSDIEENHAGAVSVYKELGQGEYELLGTLATPMTDPATVTTTALVNGDTIVATQTIGGEEGPYSAGVVVAVPAPVVQGPLDLGDTLVTVTNVHELADLVTVYVNNDTYTEVPGGADTVEVIVPALQAGSAVKATQTIDGIESPDSNIILVANYMTINEFNYDDPSTDDYAFVELYNADSAPLDISGFVIDVGDYVSVYYQVTIPASTTIAAGGYWTVGMTAVANLPGAVVDLIDDSLRLDDGHNYLALRNAEGVLLDAVAWETNKETGSSGGPTGPLVPAEIYTQIGLGIWGNHVNAQNPLTSQSRFLDGLDTDENGRDWGIYGATPGTSNNKTDLMPYVQDGSGLNQLDPVPNWVFSYVALTAIDPTVVDGTGFNPSAIPYSPDGGLAMIAWDYSGGGNCTYMEQLAKEDFTLETWIYVPPAFTPDGYEETKVGVRGSACGVHNFDWYSGATGVCWMLQHGSTWQTLYLLDENNGDDGNEGDAVCATILGSIDIGVEPTMTGWQRLLLEVSGDQVLGIFGGTYGSRTDGFEITGTHDSPGVGGVYISYREAVSVNTTARPPTLDAFSLTTPATYACGDCNCDEAVNGFDIDYFIDALNMSPEQWANTYPDCDRVTVADTNGDAAVNGFDIDGFIQVLNTGTCPRDE
ncbi:MAG: lamin tail domain-containing protein [Planctomycetes bacterium]|nr:lamin tail domain-containing protein [Planctomycetota bacterium]